jgi:hypothetical protein
MVPFQTMEQVMDRWMEFFQFLRGNMVAATLKASIAIAFISMLAVNIMDRVTEKDRDGMAQLAARANKGVQDPMTTGSIRKPGATEKRTCRETTNGNVTITTCVK